MCTHARDDRFLNENGSCDAGVTITTLSLYKCVEAVCILSLVLQNLFVLFLLLCPVIFQCERRIILCTCGVD